MSLKSKLGKYEQKLRVYQSYADGSFDKKDKERLKPLTRLRENEQELEKANSGNVKQRVRDWYNDIDRDYPKK